MGIRKLHDSYRNGCAKAALAALPDRCVQRILEILGASTSPIDATFITSRRVHAIFLRLQSAFFGNSPLPPPLHTHTRARGIVRLCSCHTS